MYNITNNSKMYQRRNMKKAVLLFLVCIILCCFTALTVAGEEPEEKKGEQLFNKHCAACHPNGGNIINSDYTLHKDSMASHGIKTPDDIVSYMRSPGTGMPAFDKEKLSDELAKEIANYILDAFK